MNGYIVIIFERIPAFRIVVKKVFVAADLVASTVPPAVTTALRYAVAPVSGAGGVGLGV
jgi:hypothetical protein